MSIGILTCCLMTAGVAATPEGTQPAQGVDVARAIAAHSIALLPGDGFGGLQLQRGGQPLHVGAFGAAGDNIFAGSPAAQQSMRAARRDRLVGTPLYLAGLASLIAGVVLLEPHASLPHRSTGRSVAGWTTLGSGVVASAAGSLFLVSSQNGLLRAVAAYNADLVAEFLPPQERPMAGASAGS